MKRVSTSFVSPSLLTEIFDSFEEAVIVADPSRRMIYVNAATETLFGYSRKALYGKETEMLYADKRDFSEQGRIRYNVGSKISTETYKVEYRRADGEPFLALTTGAAMRSPDGVVVGFIGIIRPARSADQSLDTLQRVHHISSDVTLTHDEIIEALLRVGLHHFGLQIAIVSHIINNDYIVENCVDFNEKLQPLMQFDVAGTYCTHVLRQNKPLGFHFVRNSEIHDHPCYKDFQLESYIGAPISLNDNLYGTINFSSLLPTEPFSKDDYVLMELLSDTLSYLLYKRATEEELLALARTDELTGLLNRRASLERLSELMEISNRSGSSLTVLSVDIDHFKSINDRFGHAAGDTALIKFARIASGLGRKTDFCGRIGGEEFVFVLPNADLEFGLKFGDRLRNRLMDEPVLLEIGKSLTLSVSGGLAMLENDDSLESLLARADDAMYRAKQEGRDRVCQ